uniref:Uncharacterized protein n=1 Tax=Monopterus albus TaxID=43700 RepID=A0A3Q3K4L9_MONAL
LFVTRQPIYILSGTHKHVRLGGCHVGLGWVAATSLMSYQNRLALDFILIEKGGVCFMIGQQCCTHIPNNTVVELSVFAHICMCIMVF